MVNPEIENPSLEGLYTICPIRNVVARLGDRWTVLVLIELEKGTLRFSELQRRIGDISPRMLSQTVRHLEEDGLVTRTVYPTIPPKVEYTLSALGHSFVGALQGVVIWAVENRSAVLQARSQYVPPTGDVAK